MDARAQRTIGSWSTAAGPAASATREVDHEGVDLGNLEAGVAQGEPGLLKQQRQFGNLAGQRLAVDAGIEADAVVAQKEGPLLGLR
jgi:hypothetical protein